VLFLDEPMTGLDSFNSLAVMKVLVRLAKVKGKTVIATIHQPRSSVFELFDKLILLDKGRVVYFGAAKKGAEYFEKLV
jgi:ABC-type multidrug transport system ATPase subunit